MDIIIALLPALLWGCTPLWTHFMGGKPISQLLGTTYGALVVGIVVYLIKKPHISVSDFLWCFLAGAGWSIGQLSQYVAFKKLGVATTTPINAGVQLVAVNIAGVLWFGSWQSTNAKIIGFTAMILVIIGVFLTTRTGEKTATIDNKNDFARNVVTLVAGSLIGYGSCSVLPKIPDASGFVTFPPQSVGMLAAAALFAVVIKDFREQKPFFNKHTLKNILTGFNSGLGTFSYLVSISLNGVSTGFTLSQMTTVVGTFGGLVILHEKKTPLGLSFTITGVILVVIGGVMTGFIR